MYRAKNNLGASTVLLGLELAHQFLAVKFNIHVLPLLSCH